ncbi:MAG TPA: GNAT family N-acetyltransferase [Ilumatobacteraceae bacterium]|nr:GNAT family N-acetyltransferase [Ilumatobacteraceae bacterium]
MTDRLQLEPLRPSHAAEMVTVLAASELYRYTGGTPPTLDDLERRYAAQTAGSPTPGETWHNWIIRVPTEVAVGFLQATVNAQHAEIAWVIATHAQGVGYAREAATAVVTWLTSVGINQIDAHIHPDHVRSRNVAAAIGLALTDARDDDGEDIWTCSRLDLPNHEKPA